MSGTWPESRSSLFTHEGSWYDTRGSLTSTASDDDTTTTTTFQRRQSGDTQLVRAYLKSLYRSWLLSVEPSLDVKTSASREEDVALAKEDAVAVQKDAAAEVPSMCITMERLPRQNDAAAATIHSARRRVTVEASKLHETQRQLANQHDTQKQLANQMVEGESLTESSQQHVGHSVLESDLVALYNSWVARHGYILNRDVEKLLRQAGFAPTKVQLAEALREDPLDAPLSLNKFLQCCRNVGSNDPSSAELASFFLPLVEEGSSLVPWARFKHIMQGMGEGLSDLEAESLKEEFVPEGKEALNYKDFIYWISQRSIVRLCLHLRFVLGPPGLIVAL